MCAILQLVSAPLNPIPIAEHFRRSRYWLTDDTRNLPSLRKPSSPDPLFRKIPISVDG